MRASTLAFVAATLLALAGCATTHESYAVPALHRYAAFDLSCPAEQLQIMEIGQDVYGVKGCGKRARYQLQSCNAANGECTFVRTGPVERD